VGELPHPRVRGSRSTAVTSPAPADAVLRSLRRPVRRQGGRTPHL